VTDTELGGIPDGAEKVISSLNSPEVRAWTGM
jgi:hypothetical protein